MEHKIRIDNISKNIKGTTILNQITFEAKPGKVTAFLGPNGAGKSSTLRILLGLDYANSGTALIDDLTYPELVNPLLTVGASLDGVGAPFNRTVYQHLRILSASNGIKKTRIKEVLAMTRMESKVSSHIGTLSLGEGQRLGIATALLGDPQYLILDEPTNGLDPNGIRWFREFIKNQAKAGKTVLLSSHILSEVEAITDDVIIMNHGNIITKGSLSAVMNNMTSLEEVFFHLTKEEVAE